MSVNGDRGVSMQGDLNISRRDLTDATFGSLEMWKNRFLNIN